MGAVAVSNKPEIFRKLESNLNVSQVAAFVGYSKPSNFAAAFKKKYGVIPKNYKTENTIG